MRFSLMRDSMLLDFLETFFCFRLKSSKFLNVSDKFYLKMVQS